METTTASGQPVVDREKTTPFLIRAFIKIGSFHRLNLFEDGTLPTTDEQQLFTWKDATLREVLTTLRSIAPQTPEYRHPLARYSFRAIYADSANRGRYAQKDLGMVYSRDILGEPGTLNAPAARLVDDGDDQHTTVDSVNVERQERTLDELRFVAGDYLAVAVLLPKNVTLGTGPAGEVAIKGAGTIGGAGAGAGTAGLANGWRGKTGDGGWAGGVAPASAPVGRGGGHWRGDSNPAPPLGRGGGRGRGSDFVSKDRDKDRDREIVGRERERDVVGRERDDRRVPPPRRGDSPPRRGDSPPPRGGWARGGRKSRSRSRSPPPRRRGSGRYD